MALRLHLAGSVSAPARPTVERRRASDLRDRRRNSRSGRRAGDPHVVWHWRRLAWLFAAYACYLSVRGLPATAKKLFQKTPVAPA